MANSATNLLFLAVVSSLCWLGGAFKPTFLGLACSSSARTCAPRFGRSPKGILFQMTGRTPDKQVLTKVSVRATTRYVQYDEIDHAVNLFQRSYEAGKGYERVLVAKGINLHHWLFGSPFSEMFPNVRFHAIFEGAVVDEKTSADLYVVKLQKAPHEALISTIITDLGLYARSVGDMIFVGCGELILQNEIRRPDSAIVPRLSIFDEDPPMPRVLVEDELHNRSGPEADVWCRQYFSLIPQLRAVLCVKVYPRREDPTKFGALAVLYRRKGNFKPYVEDAVSFGTAPFAEEGKDKLPTDITEKIRYMDPVSLPIGPVTLPCPWTEASRPYILFKRQDIFFWRFFPPGKRQMIPGLKVGARDCKVDLWRALCSLNQFRII